MANFYIVRNGTAGTANSNNTNNYTQLNATGTIPAGNGDLFIVDPAVNTGWTFTGAGNPSYRVEFLLDNSNSGVAQNTITFSTGHNPTVFFAAGVDADRFNFAASSAGNFTLEAGDGASVGDITGGNTSTTITAGDDVTIRSITTSSSDTGTVTLGDNATVSGVVNMQATGSTQTLTTGTNATFGGDINIAVPGTFTVSLGDDSTVNGNINAGASGTAANPTEYTVTLGNNVDITGDIAMGGSFIDANVTIGAGSTIGSDGTGNILLGGSTNDIDLTFGDGATVNGTIAMGGANSTQTIIGGDNVTITGDLTVTGSNNTNFIQFGDNWRISDIRLGASANDQVILGAPASGQTITIDGGAGNQDGIRVMPPLDPAGEAAFEAAAELAGWAQNKNGSWSPTAAGQTLTFGGVTYQNFETAATPLCFARGTLILTAEGSKPIEELKIGDAVMTIDSGFQTVRWIGSTAVSAARLDQAENLRPIRIAAGALGQGLPQRDLVVSPQHRILLRSKVAEQMFGAREVLVAAKALTDLPGITVDDTVQAVEYWHMLFDKHEVVFAEGAATESLFTGPEALKSVAPAARAEILTLFPELRDPELYPAPQAARMLVPVRPGRKLAEQLVANGRSAQERAFHAAVA